jgi:hypothetical protein
MGPSPRRDGAGPGGGRQGAERAPLTRGGPGHQPTVLPTRHTRVGASAARNPEPRGRGSPRLPPARPSRAREVEGRGRIPQLRGTGISRQFPAGEGWKRRGLRGEVLVTLGGGIGRARAADPTHHAARGPPSPEGRERLRGCGGSGASPSSARSDGEGGPAEPVGGARRVGAHSNGSGWSRPPTPAC